MRSFVNIIATPKGGARLSGFENALLERCASRWTRTPASSRPATTSYEDDVLAGLHGRAHRAASPPQFRPGRGGAGRPPPCAVAARVVEAELTGQLTSKKRDDKAQAGQLLEKVVAEMKSRISARVHKETQRRKNALETCRCPPSSWSAARGRGPLGAVHRGG
ncbi:hypothetical protein QJS66_04980 [Kocuria rhizophila]|nr:hypothetical protein QJS66_04980 [Kocuria rhizophila]